MFFSAYVASLETALMTLEASNVIALRLRVLSKGDANARREAELMISEKTEAFSQAGVDVMLGVSNAVIRNNFRAAILANEARLSAL